MELTWSATANAQIYFVLYLESADAEAGNYDSVRIATFTDTKAVITAS